MADFVTALLDLAVNLAVVVLAIVALALGRTRPRPTLWLIVMALSVYLFSRSLIEGPWTAIATWAFGAVVGAAGVLAGQKAGTR